MLDLACQKLIGTTVYNFYNENKDLSQITGVTANKNNISVVGTNITSNVKDNIVEVLNKNNLKFNNLDMTNMNISVTVDEKDVEYGIRYIHNLFFEK